MNIDYKAAGKMMGSAERRKSAKKNLLNLWA